MLWEYITDNYDQGEPIIASDIEIGLSESNKRRQFKILVDSGKLKRFDNGIYYIPKKSKLDGEVCIPPGVFVQKKYVARNEPTHKSQTKNLTIGGRFVRRLVLLALSTHARSYVHIIAPN